MTRFNFDDFDALCGSVLDTDEDRVAQDREFQTLQDRVRTGELTEEDADQLYFNWVTYGTSLVMQETVVPPSNQLMLYSE